MPVEIIGSDDSITKLVQFRTSPVFEMLVSLHTLLADRRHQQWSAETKAKLSPELCEELKHVYAPFNNGALFPEIAIGYEFHEDIEGFLQYVRRLDPVTFIFYFIGRIVTPEQIAATWTKPDKLYALMQEHPFTDSHLAGFPVREAIADIVNFKARLINVWERYWREFFSTHVDSIRPRWAQAIDEKRAYLQREGGRALLELVTGRPDSIHVMPADMPVTEMIFVPIYYISNERFVFYGYGNETILFDSERTNEQAVESVARRKQTIEVLKALSDQTRLDLLSKVAHNYSALNGKQLAAQMHLSPSTVSRQLAQLRDAGLITEMQREDGSVTHVFNKEVVESLSANVFEIMYGNKKS